MIVQFRVIIEYSSFILLEIQVQIHVVVLQILFWSHLPICSFNFHRHDFGGHAACPDELGLEQVQQML